MQGHNFLLLSLIGSCVLQASELGTVDRRSAFFSKYPATEKESVKCVRPNLNTDRSTKRYRTNLTREIEAGSLKRFAGIFGLIKNGLTGGSEWFVYSCTDGAILGMLPVPALSILSTPTSRALIVNPDNEKTNAYGPPQYYIWERNRFTPLSYEK